jgi:RNA polymerase sigma factor (TIGR02999 family)
MAAMGDVTDLLGAMEREDLQAAADLLPLVYDELRRLASQRLARELPGQTLAPTALVHEAYLRLVGKSDEKRWHGKGHFFAAAAEAMRRILVEQARRRRAVKRGGQVKRESLDACDIDVSVSDDHILAVHEALDELTAADANAATLVKLRFFSGFTMAEAAEVLGISVRSAHDVWTYARSWLRRQMRTDQEIV